MDNSYIYTAWLRDNNSKPEDQDFEFPACLVIKAKSDSMAKEWGDKIFKKYVDRNLEIEFLKSEISSRDSYEDSNLSEVPVIEYGYEPTDAEIGL